MQKKLKTILSIVKKLRPVNEPQVIISSRTDAGVHCINSTVHVDLKHHKTAFDPEHITFGINKFFNKVNVPVRILKTFIVPTTFHCRYNAISRTYLYKLAVINNYKNSILTEYIPIEDYDRCLYICAKDFDLDTAQKAAKLFEGEHDFRSFMGRETLHPNKVTRRNIEKLEIYEKPLPTYKHPSCISSTLNYKYYEVVVKSTGFLYKQVRRTVASLIAVAKGIVTPKDIKFMIEIPSHRSWNPRIKTVAAHGLYLCEVAYLTEDRQKFKENLDP
ncbi:tRNA pseudouridine synthase-like 1 [Agrilus planipennis]|uniref:tRNA pseudouridine synthase n=1 Tax=Agrilus planipennis TaxID=224129 RepID=A0A7F5R7V4_AGRPL|nr:tRNA pseudouridine synthase-like 1 [Agrilus planipennis]